MGKIWKQVVRKFPFSFQWRFVYVIDPTNQKNSMKRNILKNKLKLDGIEIQSKPSIEEAINSLPLKNDEIILITGSLYLAGEVLNLN